MRAEVILLPMCAQVLLTLLVWLWMYYTRISTIQQSKINLQDLADETKSIALLNPVVNPSDNLENLFELPVLFYVGCLAIFMTGSTDLIFVSLAWTFVGFRTLHSLIHCTSNRIKHRFAAYLFSAIALWVLWARFAIQLISSTSNPM